MSDAVYIHWNITNWITIVLMAFLGGLILTWGAQAYHTSKGN